MPNGSVVRDAVDGLALYRPINGGSDFEYVDFNPTAWLKAAFSIFTLLCYTPITVKAQITPESLV